MTLSERTAQEAVTPSSISLSVAMARLKLAEAAKTSRFGANKVDCSNLRRRDGRRVVSSGVAHLLLSLSVYYSPDAVILICGNYLTNGYGPSRAEALNPDPDKLAHDQGARLSPGPRLSHGLIGP